MTAALTQGQIARICTLPGLPGLAREAAQIGGTARVILAFGVITQRETGALSGPVPGAVKNLPARPVWAGLRSG